MWHTWLRGKMMNHPYLVIRAKLDDIISKYKIKHKYSNSFLKDRNPYMDYINNTFVSKSWKEKTKRRNQYK